VVVRVHCAKRYHACSEVVELWSRSMHAKEHDPLEARLKEERSEYLEGNHEPDSRLGKLCKPCKAQTKLKGKNDTGHNPNSEAHCEDAQPEAIDLQILRILRPEPEASWTISRRQYVGSDGKVQLRLEHLVLSGRKDAPIPPHLLGHEIEHCVGLGSTSQSTARKRNTRQNCALRNADIQKDRFSANEWTSQDTRELTGLKLPSPL
jgi:hypothetical protein